MPASAKISPRTIPTMAPIDRACFGGGSAAGTVVGTPVPFRAAVDVDWLESLRECHRGYHHKHSVIGDTYVGLELEIDLRSVGGVNQYNGSERWKMFTVSARS